MKKNKFDNDTNLNSIESESHLSKKFHKNSSETFDSDVKNYNVNKKIVESYILNNTSLASDKKKSGQFFKENNDNFFTYQSAHKQFSFLSKGFKTIKNIELNKKLDLFLEEEVNKNKLAFPQIDFNVEAIIDRNIQYKENGSAEYDTFYNSNKNHFQNFNSNSVPQETGNKESQLKPDKDLVINISSANYLSNQTDNINNIFKFVVISNIFLYDFEFMIKENTLNIIRKVHLLSVDFFSLTPDFRKLIIHINNILDNGGNLCLTNESAVQIVFCISNILFHCYSASKNLVVIPKSYVFYEKSKKIFFYDRMREFYNEWTQSLFSKIGRIIPFDKNEKLVKCVPLLKIESKFTDTKNEKILLISNKKIYELVTDSPDLQQINIYPFSKMRKIQQYNKTHKFHIILENENTSQMEKTNSLIYSSIHSRWLVKLIKSQHEKECLLDLEILKMD